jgi:hypothetical protein
MHQQHVVLQKVAGVLFFRIVQFSYEAGRILTPLVSPNLPVANLLLKRLTVLYTGATLGIPEQ